MSASVSVVKSTNVRTKVERAAELFFRTRRSAPQEGERDVLASAQELVVPHPSERIAAWSWGKGDDVVVLVHGWNGRATQLGGFVAPLLGAGRRVVAFDHVGHGASSGASCSMIDMADALAAVVRTTGARSVVAHSLGAGAAVVAMSQGAAIDRAVLIAPPLEPDRWFRMMTAQLGLSEPEAAQARELCEARVGRTFASLHLPTVARALRQPALIVHDREDREIPIEAGEALSYAWEGTRLYVTAGLGHNRVLRSPDVIERATRFLSE
jgi:pimeloyl-ACP methyl ester carboxylesterase